MKGYCLCRNVVEGLERSQESAQPSKQEQAIQKSLVAIRFTSRPRRKKSPSRAFWTSEVGCPVDDNSSSMLPAFFNIPTNSNEFFLVDDAGKQNIAPVISNLNSLAHFEFVKEERCPLCRDVHGAPLVRDQNLSSLQGSPSRLKDVLFLAVS